MHGERKEIIMKDPAIEKIVVELKELITRSNQIIKDLEKEGVTVRIWNKTTDKENYIEIIDILQKVDYQ
jgi:predicted transcriptional regulator